MEAKLKHRILRRWSRTARRCAAKRPTIIITSMRGHSIANGFAPLVIGADTPSTAGDIISFTIRVNRVDGLIIIDCEFPSNTRSDFTESIIRETKTEDFSEFIQVMQDLALKGFLKRPE